MPGHLAGAAGNPVGFVNYYKVPPAVYNGLYTLAVVFVYSLLVPTRTLFQGFDGIHRANDLVKALINIRSIVKPSYGIVIPWQYNIELLVELLLHFNMPLGDQPLRAYNQRSFDKAPGL